MGGPGGKGEIQHGRVCDRKLTNSVVLLVGMPEGIRQEWGLTNGRIGDVLASRE